MADVLCSPGLLSYCLTSWIFSSRLEFKSRVLERVLKLWCMFVDFLFKFLVACLMVLTNCLLKAGAFC